MDRDMSFWEGKRVFVPGGAGGIGSYLCEFLVEVGADVVVLDDLSSGAEANLSGIAGQIEFVRGDVRDRGLVDTLISGADVAMNLAGVAPGLYEEEGRHELLYRKNLEIADSVLDCSLRNGVERLLVVSSSCVYPDDAIVPTPELSIEEGEPEAANRGYGLAKREIERRAIAAARESHLKIAIARPFNVYSDRDLFGGKGGHVIPSLLERVLKEDGGPVEVWGSGKQTRSFIHAKDLVRGLLGLTEVHACGDAVNVGSSRELRMSELVGLLVELCGVEREIFFDASKPEGALRKGADTARLRQVLTGFREQVDFREGLADVVAARRAGLAGACLSSLG